MSYEHYRTKSHSLDQMKWKLQSAKLRQTHLLWKSAQFDWVSYFKGFFFLFYFILCSNALRVQDWKLIEVVAAGIQVG